MKDFFKSTTVKAFLVVVLVLVLLALFTSNSTTSFISSAVNDLTYGFSKVSAAATSDNVDNKSLDELKEENEKLKEENQELREQIVDYYNTKVENTRLWKFYELKKSNPEYTIVPSTVLRRDPNSDFYSFIIDKGSSSQVKVNDPVVNESGLVGYISEVDDNTSKVVTILSPQTSVSCIDSSSRDSGVVTGNSKFGVLGEAIFTKLKATHKVKKDDIITTTGISGMYPKDIIVGKVLETSYDKFDTSFYAIIKPYFDIQKITDVAVITDFTYQGEIVISDDDEE